MYIIKDISECKMNVISNISYIFNLKLLVDNLGLKKILILLDILHLLTYISKIQVYIYFHLLVNLLD